MVDFSMTNMMELLMQIVVSLLIGIVLAVPVVWIFMSIRSRKIRKKALDNIHSLKGGVKDDIKIIRNKEEGGNIADADSIRRYSERKYLDRTGFKISGTEKDRSLGGDNKLLSIKRELSNPSDTSVRRDKNKFNWD